MDVQWLEQTEVDVPAGNEWLSAAESVCFAAMHVPKRRADWRLGRWTAKFAVAACLELPGTPVAVEIRPDPSGAPEAFCAGWKLPVTISLSHRDGLACCAVANGPAALGCDLEIVEPHSPAFIADYFTGDEQRLIARSSEAGRSAMVALLWSAKESALKTLRIGLRADLRSVVVQGPPIPVPCRVWTPLAVRHAGGLFHGWFQLENCFVRTLLASTPPRAPVPLIASYRAATPSFTVPIS